MKARITQVQGGPGDGGASFIKERVQPAFRAADGCEGIISLVAEGGNGRSTTLWRDAEALEGSEQLAAGMREESQSRGYQPSILGRFDIVALDLRGGDPRAARFLVWSGSGDLKAFIRDKVNPAYGSLDGYCGVVCGSDESGGFGISLWSSREALDAAQEAMQGVRDAMGAAGFTMKTVELCDVAVIDVSQGAVA